MIENPDLTDVRAHSFCCFKKNFVKSFSLSKNSNFFSEATLFRAAEKFSFFRKGKQAKNYSFSGIVSLFEKLLPKSSKSVPIFWAVILGLTLISSTEVYSQITQRGIATSANNTTTSLTINKPAGVVVGDIMIVNIAQKGSGALSDPTSAGWTLLAGSNLAGGTNRWGTILYKIASAAEAGAYTFTLDAQANGSVGAIVAFSGVDGTTPFDVASATVSVQGSQTAVTATAKATVTTNAAVIMFGMAANSGPTFSGWTTTSPGTLTELYDNQSAGNATVGAAWAIKPTTGTTGAGVSTLSGAERNGGILIILRPKLSPTITSLGSTSGCAGSSITINGTNLGGATAVTIGGTAVASITTNTTTQITAVIGSGTTGSVVVATSGGTATSAGIFTVNPAPEAIAGGSTTVCVGTATPAFTNATAGGTWSVTNGTGSATITAGGIVTGVAAGNVTINYTLGSCSVSKALAINANPAAIGGGVAAVCSGAITPAYTNATAGGTWSIINGSGSATVGSGTGIVTGVTPGSVTVVYTISGCSATQSVTINPAPAAIAGGSTTVCVGTATPPFTNATAGGTWSVTNGTGLATITAGGIVTGVAAGNVTVNYALGSCSVTKALTVTVAPLASVTPAPANSGTGICYAGSGAVASVSWAVSAGATSYDIYFGAGSLPSIVTATVVTNSYSTGTLLANTTYYWQVVAKNNCGSAASVVWTFTTATSSCLSYCTPNYTTAVNPITNVNFAGINNTTSNVINGTPVFEVFPSPTGTVEQGETYSISVSGNTNGNTNYGVIVYFDWNQNGVFTDPGEGYQIGVINNTATGPATTNAIVVPIGATIGNTRMRVMFANGIYSASCTSGAYSGQVEDYTVLVTPVTCLRPIALVASAITATTTTISWTAPSPAPANGYDYFITVFSATPNSAQVPTPSAGAGITTVNLTGLTTGLTYYVWVRGNCGGSDYSVWSTQLQFTTLLSNDSCAGAIPLTVNSGTSCVTATEGTTAGATPTLVGCDGNADDDVWYSFTAAAASHIVTVVPGTIKDPVFQVFRTSCTGMSIACINTTSVTATETTTLTGLIAGATYWVRVYSFGGNTNQGTFTICVTTVPPPYCAPTSAMSNRYINSYQTVGSLNNTVNLNTGRSATGYQDYTALPAATQVALGGINIDIVFAVSRQYLKAWVDWNGNGVFTDAAPELVYTSAGVQSIATSFGFVIPLGTAPVNYRLRVRSYEASQVFDSCGYLNSGETEDYTITVIADCTAKITSVTDGSRCESGTVDLVAAGSGSPTAYRWYDAETGGNLIGTSTTGNWTTPSISTTTIYYVKAFNGCESLVGTKVIATVYSSSVINVSPSTPEVCGEGNIVTVTATGDTMVEDLINENFEGTGLGVLSSVLISGAGDALTQWQKKASTFIPVGSVWKPAISSRNNGNNFAFTTSDYNLDVNAALESATFNTVPYSNLTLTFRHFYSYYGVPYDGAYVEVSTNGGTTWTPVVSYTSNQAVATKFETVTINLNAYVNQPTFQLRFRYNARFCDGWAIDDVRLFGTKPMNTTFTWSGATVAAFVDSLCTIPYTTQSVTTVYVKPTPAQMTAPSWSFTATATLGNGCPVSKLIIVDNKTRFWQGTNVVSPTSWGEADNWLPAMVPDATNCVIIPNHTIISGSGTTGYAKNVIVKSTGTLDIQSNNNLTVTEWVNVNAGGVFSMENNGSLVQIDNVANSGIMRMKRNTQPMYRYDYTYWGSPLTQASGFTLGNLSLGSSLRYTWTPSVGGQSGNWAAAGSATTMAAAKGYIVRAPDSFSTNPAIKVPYVATFIGTPNNGDITTPITFGAMVPSATNDKWNLISNPYPSAINAVTFLNHPTNLALLDGTIYFWTHNSPPAVANPDPFYGDFAINYTATDYASWNRLGGTATAAAASGGLEPHDYIAAGSAFFVKSLGVPGNAVFTNAMRVIDNNNQFYRTANLTTQATATANFERHRIWLNLTNNSGAFNQILVGYAQGATLGMDRDFDGTRFGGNGVTFYSILPNVNLGIQGRPLPFDANDRVILGYNAATAGTFSIRIDHVDGLFTTQDIYLEDKLLQVIHNLKLTPYVFTTASGNFNTRFELIYQPSALSVNDPILNPDSIIIYKKNKEISIHAGLAVIQEVKVYDIQGRLLYTATNVLASETTLKELASAEQVLIVQVLTTEGYTISRKIVY